MLFRLRSLNGILSNMATFEKEWFQVTGENEELRRIAKEAVEEAESKRGRMARSPALRQLKAYLYILDEREKESRKRVEGLLSRK